MPRWKIYAIALPAICFSVVTIWFLISVFQLDCASCAPRGGAVGVILSFAALFLLSSDRYHGIDVLDDTTKKLFDELMEEQSTDVTILVERNATRIEVMKMDIQNARTQSLWENIALAVSSFYSTLFWGFGDVFAKWII